MHIRCLSEKDHLICHAQVLAQAQQGCMHREHQASPPGPQGGQETQAHERIAQPLISPHQQTASAQIFALPAGRRAIQFQRRAQAGKLTGEQVKTPLIQRKPVFQMPQQKEQTAQQQLALGMGRIPPHLLQGL